ncbi:hypothetical protein M3Y98_00911200 [Aphelenchoides besseyi]|nr:hypothetical protein M3Y98_00911200 [Aphelenchoides besseyi]KAI6193531.1 hypothetical protein M3Y96_01027900 [Aphelenchoides besseyi]
MSFFSTQLIFLIVAIVFFTQIEARPFSDGSAVGSILAPWGGNLNAGSGYALYSNNAVYLPYGGYGFFG